MTTRRRAAVHKTRVIESRETTAQDTGPAPTTRGAGAGPQRRSLGCVARVRPALARHAGQRTNESRSRAPQGGPARAHRLDGPARAAYALGRDALNDDGRAARPLLVFVGCARRA